MPQNSTTSEVENIISDNYVNDMKCTNEDIEKIIEYAEAYGIKNRIFQQCVEDRLYNRNSKDTDGLIVVYPHFAIIESATICYLLTTASRRKC